MGVVLTLGLLGLVLLKGVQTFWPARISVMEVEGANGPEKVAGYIVQERERRDLEGVEHEEIQIFRGNRELHGEKFAFIDRSAIRSEELPDDLVLVERMEGGHVIARIKAIAWADGTSTPVEAGDFTSRLDVLLKQTEERRKELRGIEKGEIGRNARRVKELRAQEKLEGKSAAIDAELAKLNEEFLQLDAKRNALRGVLSGDVFLLEAVDGREIRIEAGELLHVFHPNRAGLFGRIGEMIRRVWEFLSSDPREANTEGPLPYWPHEGRC